MEEMEQQEEVRVAWGTGIAGHVAESGEPVNIPDAYKVSDLSSQMEMEKKHFSQFECKMGSSMNPSINCLPKCNRRVPNV